MPLAQQQARPLIEFTTAPLFQEHGIPLAVMGVLVVFMALALLAIFITVLPSALRRVTADDRQPTGIRPATTDETLSEEELLVICAAVAATVGQPHRIVHIGGLTPEDLGWSFEGRMQHHQSHRIQHRNGR